MKEKDAELIIQQMNPILKRSKFYIQKLQIDRENEDIEICNIFKAVFSRVHYPDYTILAGMKKIMEEIYG